jgi:hypothetical protein
MPDLRGKSFFLEKVKSSHRKVKVMTLTYGYPVTGPGRSRSIRVLDFSNEKRPLLYKLTKY